MSDMKPVEVGGYTLLFPQWWGEVRRREKDSLSQLNSVAAQSVTFDFNVLKGQGSQEQRELILRQLAQGYHGEETRALTLTLAGHGFEGVEILRPKVLSPSDQASVVSFIAIIDGDLVHFTVTMLVDTDLDKQIRQVALQVVEGALLRKQAGSTTGSGLPSHWQLDAEGHPVNPALVEALAAYQRAPGAETARAMYRLLCTAALILAEDGPIGGPPQAGVTSQQTQLRVRTLKAPNGALGLPAFTDTKHLRAQFPEGTAFRAIPATIVAQMLLGGQTQLVLNPGPGGASLALPRKGLEALARGEVPELP